MHFKILVKNLISILFGIILLTLSSCIHETSKEILVLNGTVSEQTPTLDPSFLMRQQKAEKSFFGLFEDENDDKDTPELSNDDIDNASNLKYSSQIDSDLKMKSSLGFEGIPIIWPTNGILTSFYGLRKLQKSKKMHTGIDVASNYGSPIWAAASGEVLFSGTKHGYGHAIILSHDENHETLYAHLSKLSVHVGQRVKRNQIIGYMGRSGHVVGGANLHFETRINGIAYNPIHFLPPPSENTRLVRLRMHTPSLEQQVAFYKKVETTRTAVALNITKKKHRK